MTKIYKLFKQIVVEREGDEETYYFSTDMCYIYASKNDGHIYIAYGTGNVLDLGTLDQIKDFNGLQYSFPRLTSLFTGDSLVSSIHDTVKPLVRFFMDSSENINILGDYSVTPKDFVISPPQNTMYVVRQRVWTIFSNGSFSAARFGGSNISLANGMKIFIANGDETIIQDITSDFTIKRTGDFCAVGAEVIHNELGSGQNYMIATFDVDKMVGGLRLYSSTGDKLVIRAQDNLNLVNITQQTVCVLGFKANAPNTPFV